MNRTNRQILVNPHSKDVKVPAGILNLGEIAVQHDSVSGAALYVETDSGSTSEETVAKFINEVAINTLIANAQTDLQTKIDAINDAVGLPHSGTTGDTQHWDENTTVWDAIEETYAEMAAGTAAANTRVEKAANPDSEKYMTLSHVSHEETSAITYTIGLEGITEAIDSAWTSAHTEIAALSGVVKEFSAATVESLSAVTEKIEQLSAATEDVLGALDFTGVTQEGKPIVNVTQENGLVSAETGRIDSEFIDYDSAHTLDEVLENIIENINANEIKSEDGSIVVTPGADGTTIKVNRDNATIVLNDNNELVADLKLSAITPSSVNVREEFALIDHNGRQLGDTVKVYKDSSLNKAFLGHVDDVLSDPTDPESLVSGSGDTALDLIYHKEDGTYVLVPIDVNDFLEESEFKDGLVVDNHVVKIKVNENSESVVVGSGETAPVLSVGPDGIKVDNIQKAINYAVADLAGSIDADVLGTSSDGHVAVEVVQEDTKLTQVVVSTDDIASEKELDKVEEAVGLNEDGSFSADPTSNFASGATSVRNEIKLIDQALKEVNDKLNAASVDEGESVENFVNLAVANNGSGATAITINDTELKNAIDSINAAISSEIVAREEADDKLLGNSGSTSAETSIMGLKKLIEETQSKLVDGVEGETGENALVQVTSTSGETGELYTVSSTEKLQNAIDAAENAIVKTEFGTVETKDVNHCNAGMTITGDTNDKTLVLDLQLLKIDCGEY